MKKFLLSIIVTIYAIIAIFVTICLLAYNDYRISAFGDYSFVIITNEKETPDYEKGDLVIVDKTKVASVGEKIFFYNTYSQEKSIYVAEVIQKEDISFDQSTYTLEGDYLLSSDYILGSANGAKVIPKVGGILRILESKWGYLFLVVFVSLVALLYEVTKIITEIRKKD